MGSGAVITGVLMVAAAVVLALYRLEVIMDVFKGSGTTKKRISVEQREADALGKALDVKAAELRATRAAHRRAGPLQLERVRRLVAPNGVVTILAENVGGRAKSVRATADTGAAHVTPATIEPDDEVQITWSPTAAMDNSSDSGLRPESQTKPPAQVTLRYVNAAGQDDRIEVRLDPDDE